MLRCLCMRCGTVFRLPFLLTPSEGVGFLRISLLLWKEWNCCGASVCAVEPFSVCRSFLLLRKESAFRAFPYSFGRSGIAAVPLHALWSRFPFAVPSYSFGRSRLFAHFSTPLEGVELLRCLCMRCGAVFRLPFLLTPSEGVGFLRISLLLRKEWNSCSMPTVARVCVLLKGTICSLKKVPIKAAFHRHLPVSATDRPRP